MRFINYLELIDVDEGEFSSFDDGLHNLDSVPVESRVVGNVVFRDDLEQVELL